MNKIKSIFSAQEQLGNYFGNKIILLYKSILLLIFIIFYIKNQIIFKINIKKKFKSIGLINKLDLDFEKKIFAILRIDCENCGLFSFYNHYLGCIYSSLKKGYIPIIDLAFHNIFNRDNLSLLVNNPWELYFNQPYGYTLENVKKNAKYIKNIKCEININEVPNRYTIYKDKYLKAFWHDIANMFIPINNNIIKESKKIMKYLLNNSNNTLGVLVRGTDYIACRPKYHARQPSTETMFKDIKRMLKKNNYDWIFLATEDELIRQKFISEFKEKIKFVKPSKNIEYKYEKKLYLYYDKAIKFDYDYFKTYIINILILSKCNDIICSRNNGSIAAFIFTDGFRNKKVYYLGEY